MSDRQTQTDRDRQTETDKQRQRDVDRECGIETKHVGVREERLKLKKDKTEEDMCKLATNCSLQTHTHTHTHTERERDSQQTQRHTKLHIPSQTPNYLLTMPDTKYIIFT